MYGCIWLGDAILCTYDQQLDRHPTPPLIYPFESSAGTFTVFFNINPVARLINYSKSAINSSPPIHKGPHLRQPYRPCPTVLNSPHPSLIVHLNLHLRSTLPRSPKRPTELVFPVHIHVHITPLRTNNFMPFSLDRGEHPTIYILPAHFLSAPPSYRRQ